MAYHTAEEMKNILDRDEEFRDKLYCRGFLITDLESRFNLKEYPFYNNWEYASLDGEYCIYIHKDNTLYTHKERETLYFLIGHAYDPFNMVYREEEILERLAAAHKKGEDAFWDEESNLTGVFFLGFIRNGEIVYSTDCCGMQHVGQGVIDSKLYLVSHTKLVADLCGLEQDAYVKRLINNKLWRFYGSWLPADLSPFAELKRLLPNNKGEYKASKGISIERYYPKKAIEEVKTEEEYNKIITELGNIMSRNMELISEKWSGKKVSISVTGGRDSMTTLACANGMYDRFSTFSYISNEPESVDAYASDEICKGLGLEHDIYVIPDESEDYAKIEIFRKILECNNGCIWHNNSNDVRKRLWFIKNPKFDVEVKSWLNEMGRAWYYKKYQKEEFPKYPTPAMLRANYKPLLSPYLIHNTTKLIRKWMDIYCKDNLFDKMSWLDQFYWEFTWSGNEGLCLTGEHNISYEITIPFNNRKYFELMLRLPLEKRKKDLMPIDLIGKKNKAIIDSGIVIKDVNLSDFRTALVRTYYAIFSRINF